MIKKVATISKFLLIFVIITAWIFSGWPRIWQNPAIPPEIKKVEALPDTLTLRPNAAGTYQEWSIFGGAPSRWQATSDQSDVTGVQVTGSTALKETENLADTTQTGTINNVTAYMTAKGLGSVTGTNSPSSTIGGWTNPANAYADGIGYANIISGTPSASQTYDGYGFSLTGSTIDQVRVRYDAWCVATAPAWQASSAIAASTGADVTVTLPAHQANDIFLLQVVVRDQDDTIIWPSGWTQIATVNRSTVSRYWWAWKRAASSAETNPLVDKFTATGDTYAAVTTYRGAITTGDPWEVKGTPNTATTAAHVLNGITTLTANSLIVASVSGEDNTAASVSYTATDPATLTSRLYVESTIGADGACAAGAGVKASVGFTGNVTATWSATVVGSGGIVLALIPGYDEQIRVNVSWDGGTNWSSQQTTGLTSTETTYWYDVTSATAWTPEKLNDTNFKVRVDAVTVGYSGDVRLDWIPVEVTYRTHSAVILWRTYDTDYESSANSITTAFANYSQTRTTNPNTGSAWTWAEVNNLEIGSRATALGSTETIQVSEFWIVVDYTLSTVTLSLQTYDYSGNETTGTVNFGDLDPETTPSVTIRDNLGACAVETTVTANVSWTYTVQASDNLKDIGANIIPIGNLQWATDDYLANLPWVLFQITTYTISSGNAPTPPTGTSYDYDYKLTIDWTIAPSTGYSTTITYTAVADLP